MSDVNITVNARDNASGTLRRIGDAWLAVATPLNQSIELARAVGDAFRAVYEDLRQVAQVEATGRTFDSLAESVGIAADALRTDLKGATAGMVSEMDLMQAANRFMAMGLGETNEEVAKLAEIGTTLGLAFRGDASAGMEEFALLLANQSIPRLDTFGISAGRVRERINELTAANKDLSREQAFLQAVMEEADKTMAAVGDQSDTLAGDLARVEAAQEDLKAAWQQGKAEGLSPFLDTLLFLGQTLGGAGGLNELVADFSAGFWSFGAVAQIVEPEIKGSEKAVEDLGKAFEASYGSLMKFTSGMDYTPVIQAFNEAMEANSEQLGGLFGELVDVSGAVDETGLALFRAAEAAGATAPQLALLGVATGVFSAAQAEAALKAAAMQQKILELGEAIAGGMSIPDALEELRLFEDSLASVEGQGRTSSDVVRDLAEKIDLLDGKSARMTIDIGVSGPGATLAAGGGIGLGQAAPGRAIGGPVYAGEPYIVGEKGRELFIPSVNGQIVPNDQMGSGGETHYHLHINGPAGPLMQEFALAEAIAG